MAKKRQPTAILIVHSLSTGSEKTRGRMRVVRQRHQRQEQRRSRFLPEYPAGSWGPLEADRLIEAEGRAWRIL